MCFEVLISPENTLRNLSAFFPLNQKFRQSDLDLLVRLVFLTLMINIVLCFKASVCLLFADYIESLPLVNTPEVFGLNPNAEIGYFTKAAKNIWHHMVRKSIYVSELKRSWCSEAHKIMWQKKFTINVCVYGKSNQQHLMIFEYSSIRKSSLQLKASSLDQFIFFTFSQRYHHLKKNHDLNFFYEMKKISWSSLQLNSYDSFVRGTRRLLGRSLKRFSLISSLD